MLHDAIEGESADRLVGAVAKGDKRALAQLFESDAGWLIAVARRIVRRRELAEEAVQDAFLAIWQRAHQFDPSRGSARGWMATIVRNRALNIVRDGARMDLHDPETLAEIGDRAADAHSAYDSLPDNHALRTCLERLDESKRRSILLSYVAGLTHGEVAATLNAPLGTVKSWIQRGVSALQECLG